LSKHREALRRGIRSLIQETSRELADLEGRDATVEAPAQDTDSAPAAPQDAPHPRAEWGDVQSAVVADTGERDAEDAAASDAGSDVDERVILDAEVLAVEVREVGPARVGPASPAPHATDGGTGWRDGYAPPAGRVPATDAPHDGHDAPEHAKEHREPDGRDESLVEPRWGPRRLESPPEPRTAAEREAAAPREEAAQADAAVRQSAPASKAHRVAGAPSAPGRERRGGEGAARAKARARKTRPRTSAKKAAASRRRAPREHRPAGDHMLLNGVEPRQVQSRKGVCSAYFVNNECWRVSDAYCNTALHVCAMRDCPVYHLHQEALERRFAAKYKHLW